MFEVYQRFRLFYQRCSGYISDSDPFISDVRVLSAILTLLSAMFGGYQRFRLFYQRCPELISDSGSFISDVRSLSAIPALLSAMSGAYQRFRLFSDVWGLSAILTLLSAMFGGVSDSDPFISDVRGLSAILRFFYQRCPLFYLHWMSIHPTIKIQSKKDASQSNFAMHLFSIGRANTSV
ncbi:hypothetical protein [Lysinibacillus xylanilyticus]|uniref:hypothetical protein n=1 Tax=Lysinibacillus xylanilyticus TaxID=582475 RepID=UPI0011120E6B|nr:hypothetical protein [Lysinibacillus xylanilyticus]